jgi:hypothetical protein
MDIMISPAVNCNVQRRGKVSIISADFDAASQQFYRDFAFIAEPELEQQFQKAVGELATA